MFNLLRSSGLEEFLESDIESKEMANSEHSSLPPSLSRISSPRSPSRPHSPNSGDDVISFPDLNQHIDVEQEISKFVRELDAHEGREEYVFTSTMNKNFEMASNGTGEAGQLSKDVLSPSGMNRDWGDDVATPTSPNKFDHVSSLKMTYYAFKETSGQKSGIPVSLVNHTITPSDLLIHFAPFLGLMD